jgi:hypothetical protein
LRAKAKTKIVMVYLALALKALTRLLKGFIINPNDKPIPCTITNDKLPEGVFNQG